MLNDNIYNVSAVLFLVLCLDLSPSMSMNERAAFMNKAIQHLLDQLNLDPKTRYAVEVAVVTFSTGVYKQDAEFRPLSALQNKTYTPVKEGGTNTSEAVMYSYELIENKIKERKDFDPNFEYYLPFFVLVTDGDPDHTDPNRQKVVDVIRSHCNTSSGEHLIAPYIIGVGNHVEEDYLNRMAEDFTGKAIMIADDSDLEGALFQELFDFIGKSIKGSMGFASLREMFEFVKKQAVRKIELIHKRRKTL